MNPIATSLEPDSLIPPSIVTDQPSRLVRLLATSKSSLPTLLRLALGGVILAHGLQKVFGWFGGYGLSGTLDFFASLGMPTLLAWLVIASDFLGSLALMLGLMTRFAAAAALAVMVGAALLVHLPNGFFMNWGGAPHGEGYEFHVLASAMAIALVLSGGGRGSIDAWLARRLESR